MITHPSHDHEHHHHSHYYRYLRTISTLAVTALMVASFAAAEYHLHRFNYQTDEKNNIEIETITINLSDGIESPNAATTMEIDSIPSDGRQFSVVFLQTEPKEMTDLPTPRYDLELHSKSDYGSIQYTSAATFERVLDESSDSKRMEEEKKAQYQQYFSNKQEENDWSYIDDEKISDCEYPTWLKTLRPLCNPFHEILLDGILTDNTQNKHVSFMGAGYFRGAFLFQSSGMHDEPFVLKLQNYHVNASYRARHERLHMEAAVMSQLSVSPYVSDTYGMCSTSIFVEPVLGNRINDLFYKRVGGHPKYGFMNQTQLDQMMDENKELSLNHLTPTEKLDISLQIAESIAEAHGLATGPLMVVDITLPQWLYNPETDKRPSRMILNDFDVSRPLPWNRRTNEYCLIKDLGGPIAPELPDNLPSDESLDVWHVGTVLYTILTGLMPYYDELEAISSIDERNEQLKELVLSHRPPHFDKTLFGRTIIESRMLDIIERCLEFDPSKRPSIFDVLEFLKATKQEIVKLERKRSSEKHVRVRQRV